MSVPGVSPTLQVVERREVVYPVRPKSQYARPEQGGQRKRRKKRDKVDDPGGVGWEIVAERAVCTGCVAVA